jgi:uncharacterized protein DUF2516
VDKLVAMASAAPLFYQDVARDLTFALTLALLIIEAVAFVNCLTQRADAFPVVGSLTKPTWLAILAAGLLVTLLCGLPGNGVSLFGLVAITAAAIYLLDVRPALRDASNGTGNW